MGGVDQAVAVPALPLRPFVSRYAQRPRGFQIQLNLDDDVAAAELIFTQLAEDGEVTVPLQQTSWARRFGAVVDRFGVAWSINCEEREAV